MTKVVSKFALAETASSHLDILRFVSALAVVIGHARATFLVNYIDLSHPAILIKILYALTALGNQAVIVFFVLSGFFIGKSVHQMHDSASWSWTQFLTRRMSRLCIVLLPSLLLCILWDRSGVALFGADGNFYGGNARGAGMHPAPLDQSGIPAVFIGNLFFLQDIWCISFGTNMPLWSLSYEFWFYLCYACIAICAGTTSAGRRWWNGLLALGILIATGQKGLHYFVIWMAGAVAAYATTSAWNTRWADARSRWIVVVGASVVAMIAGYLGMNDDHMLGFCAAVAIWAVATTKLSTNDGSHSKIYSRTANVVVGFTYSLYLCHFPLLIFLQSALLGGARWQPDLTHILLLGLIVLALCGYAWVFSRITEAKTSQFRRWITGVLARINSTSPIAVA